MSVLTSHRALVCSPLADRQLVWTLLPLLLSHLRSTGYRDSQLCVDSRDWNSGPQTCTAGALPTERLSSPSCRKVVRAAPALMPPVLERWRVLYKSDMAFLPWLLFDRAVNKRPNFLFFLEENRAHDIEFS